MQDDFVFIHEILSNTLESSVICVHHYNCLAASLNCYLFMNFH